MSVAHNCKMVGAFMEHMESAIRSTVDLIKEEQSSEEGATISAALQAATALAFQSKARLMSCVRAASRGMAALEHQTKRAALKSKVRTELAQGLKSMSDVKTKLGRGLKTAFKTSLKVFAKLRSMASRHDIQLLGAFRACVDFASKYAESFRNTLEVNIGASALLELPFTTAGQLQQKVAAEYVKSVQHSIINMLNVGLNVIFNTQVALKSCPTAVSGVDLDTLMEDVGLLTQKVQSEMDKLSAGRSKLIQAAEVGNITEEQKDRVKSTLQSIAHLQGSLESMYGLARKCMLALKLKKGVSLRFSSHSQSGEACRSQAEKDVELVKEKEATQSQAQAEIANAETALKVSSEEPWVESAAEAQIELDEQKLEMQQEAEENAEKVLDPTDAQRNDLIDLDENLLRVDQPNSKCPAGWIVNELTETCYKVFTDKSQWTEAEDKCRSQEALLAVETTYEEYLTASQLLTDSASCTESGVVSGWVGRAVDTGSSESCRWSSGRQCVTQVLKEVLMPAAGPGCTQHSASKGDDGHGTEHGSEAVMRLEQTGCTATQCYVCSTNATSQHVSIMSSRHAVDDEDVDQSSEDYQANLRATRGVTLL